MESDEELLERWRSGDREAGSRLIRRHFLNVRTYFRMRMPGEYEDLVQETFTGLSKSFDNFRGHSSFRTYLFRIARNVLAEALRKRYRAHWALGLDGALNWYRNLDRNWHILAHPSAAKITVPGLFIGGAADPVLSFTRVDRARERSLRGGGGPMARGARALDRPPPPLMPAALLGAAGSPLLDWQAHGGILRLEAREGGGTVVTCFLPDPPAA